MNLHDEVTDPTKQNRTHCPLRCMIDICSTCARGVCSCHFCVCKILPFYPIGNDQFFVEEVVPSDLIKSLTARSFNLLVDESENRPLLNSPDLDPDGNYFNSLTYDSKYCTPHSLSQDLSPLPSSLSVMHINCRSLLPKLSEIKDLLHLLPATILALTETWLEENQSDLVNIPGYQFIQKPRGTSKGGGGVGILIKGVPYDAQAFEGLFIDIPLKTGNTTIGVIYRPPGQKLDEFTGEIDSHITEILKKSKELLLIGDMNVDLLKMGEHKATAEFYNCMTAHHLLPPITRPTRITCNTSTLIDNIFTTLWPKVIKSSIVAMDTSDHLAIIAWFESTPPLNKKPVNIASRNMSVERKATFLQKIADVDWPPCEACANLDVNKAYDLFLTKYKQTYDDSFPVITKAYHGKLSPRKSWMTQG